MTKEIQEAIKSLQEKMGNEEIDGSIKFEIENVGSIVIDAGVVKESNDETDCTLSGELETFMEIFRGDTSSTAAFMGGKLKIDGSMGTAMKYNAILSQMNSPQPPKSNYKALIGAHLAYALTNDVKKIRYALWPTGD